MDVVHAEHRFCTVARGEVLRDDVPELSPLGCPLVGFEGMRNELGDLLTQPALRDFEKCNIDFRIKGSHMNVARIL